jgi:hypothetical protein
MNIEKALELAACHYSADWTDSMVATLASEVRRLQSLLLKFRNKRTRDVPARVTEYLSAGGLFNPELMDHVEVRGILIDARDVIEIAVQCEDLLREAEGLLCDPQGGPVGVELAERIRAYFANDADLKP